ncbi:MAG: OmpA family protein [Thermodesulfovibrionales bacterium]|nr:OmpA family protein [Thermodesulfovibrionales bacterium]
MADKKSIIIIKKVKKGHGGAHGGSWKVAYADFVTAMMAFFLLLWLLAMVSPEKRAALSQYFKHFSLFDKGGHSFMMEGQPQMVTQQGSTTPKQGLTFGSGDNKDVTPKDISERVKQSISDKLSSLKNQTMVDIFEGGVRIQIFDLEGKSLFKPGSAELSPIAKEIIKVVSESIKDLPNKIAVEGHTDSSPLRLGKITNWELSSERASAARRELEANGINTERIARVVGYADTEPLFVDDPNDTRNRRISLIILQNKPEGAPIKQPTGQNENRNPFSRAIN